MLTNDTGEGGLSPSVTADNMQQIKHIGATVGTLAKHQEDRFQALEHQLNALSDKLDDIILDNLQFTPPESSNPSDSASSRSDSASVSSQHSTMPRSPCVDMAPATVGDVGGYFCPNCPQHGHSGQQHISDVSSFVGRVKRTLRTKSITNIEIFLRGSALRWFQIGLKTDGTHVFDNHRDEFDIDYFCESLIILFGVPEHLASAVNIEALPLTSSWKRSVIVEEYVFPALEYVRPQEALFSPDSSASAAVSKALALYNKSFESCTVSPELFDRTTYPEIRDCDDLLYILGDLRCSELEQKFDRTRLKSPKVVADVASAKVTTGGSEKEPLAYSKGQQDLVPASTSDLGSQVSTLSTAELHLLDWMNCARQSFEAQSESSIKVADSIANATGPYPPAPTAEPCPASPIASCQSLLSNLDSVSQTKNLCGGIRVAVTTQPEKELQPIPDDAGATYNFLDYCPGARGISMEEPACNEIGPSMSKFGISPGCQSTRQQVQLQRMAQMQQDVLNREAERQVSSQGHLCTPTFTLSIDQRPDSSQLDDVSHVSKHDSTSARVSRLAALYSPAPEQKKEVERLEKAAQDILTSTATPYQEDYWSSAAIPDYESHQQSLEQQALPTQRYFPIGPQAKAFLNGFKVFPPTSIDPNTTEYKNYRDRIMGTLTGLVFIQEDSVNRFQESHGKILQLEAAGQTADSDLISARDAARRNVKDAKSEIDGIRNENEKNRCA